MKRLILLTNAMLSLTAWAQTHTLTATVTNTMQTERTAEPVVVKLNEIKGLKFTPKAAVVTIDGKEVPSQLDDLDGDLRADELAFLADIPAASTIRYQITLSADGEQKEYATRMYSSLSLVDKKDVHPETYCVEAPGESYLFNDIFMHGITFESELTGYRIYFDPRQNIDLYGKKYRRIEMPETRFYTSAEQLAQGYGVDVLWAGGAIGCGTFRGWDGKAPLLFDDVKVRGQRVVCSGPVRVIAELKDYGWNVNGKASDTPLRVNARTWYTMYAGHRDVSVKVMFDEKLPDVRFCTGVQKVGATATDSVRRGIRSEGWVNANGLAASWGCDYPDMGKKAIWPPEAIGMAVYVPQRHIASTLTDDLNYIIVLDGKGKTELTYQLTFCADKEADGYHTAQQWFDSLEAWKQGIDNPVRISIK